MFSHRLARNVKNIPSLWKQATRSAGHSKWHNIRHTKAAKDEEKAVSIARKLRDIRLVLSENGNITDVSQSARLARVVDAAMRENVPKESIENLFKRIKSERQAVFDYRLRGPNDCIIVVTFSCIVQDESEVRGQIKRILQKCSHLKLTHGFTHVFEPKGVILAKLTSKNASMDDAEEAAIIAGAEEVAEEVNDAGVFRFLTEPGSVGSATKSLRENEWEIFKASLENLPTYLVELSDSEIEGVIDEVKRFQNLPEYLKIVDNIA